MSAHELALKVPTYDLKASFESLADQAEIDEEGARRQFIARLNEDFARLRSDPAAWAEELEERAAWDSISTKVAD